MQDKIGLCLSLDEHNTPMAVEEFSGNETLPLVLFLEKGCVQINDHISAFIFIEDKFVFEVSFDIEFESQNEFIYAQLTTTPNLLTYTNNNKSLYKGFIGVAKNNEQLGKVEYRIRSKNVIYSNPNKFKRFI